MPARGILFDLDGVLYNADQPIPGAAGAVRWAHAQRIPHLFVTNTTSRPRSTLAEKLASFGMPATVDQILTPALAAAESLANQPNLSLALFVRPDTRAEFSSLPFLPDSADPHQPVTHVIIGDLGHHWDYATLNHAFRLLHYNPSAHLIALGMTRYWLAPDGISLDVAPFVTALEHATGRHALVYGKPAAPFFAAAASKLRLAPSDLLMIGDDIQTDIGGAQACGLQTALVKTGKFRPADLHTSIQPDIVLESVADLSMHWSS